MACLVMIRAWVNAGRPRPPVRPLGSFESWSYVIGGVLHNANVGASSKTWRVLRTRDSEGQVWRNSLRHGGTSIPTRR